MRGVADNLRQERDDLLEEIEAFAREMKALPNNQRSGILLRIATKTARLKAVLEEIETTGQ
jgi:predicted O-methyltransferase YrrM